MKVISSVHSIKMLCAFFLFTLFSFFTSTDLKAQCAISFSSNPAKDTLSISGSMGIYGEAAMANVVTASDGTNPPSCASGCDIWIYDPDDDTWKNFLTLGCDDSGTYEVLSSSLDPNSDMSCASTIVEIELAVVDDGIPSFNTSDGSTPDCGSGPFTLNTNMDYDFTSGSPMAKMPAGSYDCISNFTWNHPTFEDNCGFGRVELTFTKGTPEPDDLPSDKSWTGNLTVNNLGGQSINEDFYGSSSTDPGQTIVKYYLYDASGNVDSCSFTVNVSDNEDPTWEDYTSLPDTSISRSAALDSSFNVNSDGRAYLNIVLDCNSADFSGAFNYWSDFFTPDADDNCDANVMITKMAALTTDTYDPCVSRLGVNKVYQRDRFRWEAEDNNSNDLTFAGIQEHFRVQLFVADPDAPWLGPDSMGVDVPVALDPDNTDSIEITGNKKDGLNFVFTGDTIVFNLTNNATCEYIINSDTLKIEGVDCRTIDYEWEVVQSVDQFNNVTSLTGNSGAGDDFADDFQNNWPVGVHDLRYTLTDECGNESKFNFVLQINDTIRPNITECPPSNAVKDTIPAIANNGECQTQVDWMVPVPEDCSGVTSFTAEAMDGDSNTIIINTGNLPGGTCVDVVGFSGIYAPVNWTTITNGGDGSVDESAAPSQIEMEEDATTGVNTDYQTNVTDNGVISFSYIYTGALGAGDEFGYVLNGNYVELAGGAIQTGNTVVTVSSGDVFSFRLEGRVGGIFGLFNARSSVEISNFEFQCKQGAFADFPVGVSCVSYIAEDGVGNRDTCKFFVTVEDQQAPTFLSPIPDEMLFVDEIDCDDPLVPDYTSLAYTYGDDNCAIDSVSQIPEATTSIPLVKVEHDSVFEVVLQIFDAEGNMAPDTFNVTIKDNVSPVISCPADTTIAAGVNCDTSSFYLPHILTDACADIYDEKIDTTRSDMAALAADFQEGRTTITYTYTDGGGNSASCSYDVIVEDQTAPQIDALPDLTVQTGDDGGYDCATEVSWKVVASDNCDTSPSITSIPPSGSSFDVDGSPHIVTVTAQDAAGNSSQTTFKITVKDNQNPEIFNCSGSETVPSTCPDTEVPFISRDFRDNCRIDTVIQTPDNNTALKDVMLSTDVAPPGLSDGDQFIIETVVYDQADLTDTCFTTVTLSDQDRPVPSLNMLRDTFYSCDTLILDAPTASDCEGNTIYGSANAGIFIGNNQWAFPPRLYFVTWTYTDPDNNKSSSQTQNIEVEKDTTKPSIACPQDASFNTTSNGCNTTKLPGISMSEVSIFSASVGDPGTYADTCGIDSVSYALNGLSNGSTVARKRGKNAGIETFAAGITEVTYYVTDIHGNEETCTFEVTVNDVTPPIINVPANDTVRCDAIPKIADLVVATDNCQLETPADGTIEAADVEETTIDSLCPNTYTLRRVWTAKDTANNITRDTQFVRVLDTMKPEFTYSEGELDVTSSNDARQCGAQLNIIIDLDDVTDACGDEVAITNNSPYGPGTESAAGFYPIGQGTVTFTATDSCGNSSTYEVDWVVTDDEEPLVVCEDGISYNLPSNDTLILLPSDLYKTIRDNCNAIDSTWLERDTFSCVDATGDIIEVDVYARDTAGNIGFCTATFRILDQIPPEAHCFDTVYTYLGADGTSTVMAEDLDSASVDNCEGNLELFIGNTNTTSVSYDCSDLMRIHDTTLIVVDPSDNNDICQSTIVVLDTISPTAQCMDITVRLDSMGMVVIDSNAVDNGSFDNCEITRFEISPQSFNCTHIGTQVVTMYAYDKSGNVDSCSANVKIVDEIGPLAVCQDITVYLDSLGNVTISPEQINNGSSDNCDNDLDYSLKRSSFTCVDTDAPKTVILTIEDDSNNQSQCSALVTVLDTISPTAVCKNDTVYLDQNGRDTLKLFNVYDSLLSFDNCDIKDVLITASTSATNDTRVVNCDDRTIDGINPPEEFTVTVFDESNNSSSCIALVDVYDTLAPILDCEDITVEVDSRSGEKIIAADVISRVSDNCDVKSTTISRDSFSCSDIGIDNTVDITVTAEDFSGNESSCVATVTVIYRDAPTALCQNITVELGEEDPFGNQVAGIAVIEHEDIDAGSVDACGRSMDLSLQISQDTFACDDLGDQTVTLTVTDRFGVSNTCTSTVTVEPSKLDVLLDDVSGDQGQVVTIPITVNDFTEITSLQFTVEILDGTVGRFVDVNGNLVGADVTIIADDVVSFRWDAPAANPVSRVNGSFIAFLDVELTGTTGESSDVIFTDSQLSREWSSDCDNNPDANFDFDETNGSITVDMSPAMYTMSGTVRYYNGMDSVRNVSIEITGHGFPDEVVQTDVNGEYSFMAIAGSDPVITPLDLNSGFYASERDYYLAKDGGNQTVTALDQFIISSDIFGITPLSGPYQHIAADVAASPQGIACNGAEINIGDISEIENVLLLSDSWAHKSWVFVPANFMFANPDCPWEDGYDEAINISNVVAAQSDLDFIAIKIGDVNGSFNLNTQLNGGGQNKSAQLNIKVQQEGNVLRFVATNGNQIGSIQFGIKYNKNLVNIANATVHQGLMQSAKLAVKPNAAEVIFTAFDVNTAELEGKTLFEIELMESVDAELDELIQISTEILSNEVYSEIQGFGKVVLNEATSTNADETDLAQFELLQNAPNPFNQSTQIRWILPYSTSTDVIVLNDLGQTVFSTTVQGKKGMNTINIQNANLPATGVYYYQVKTNDFFGTKSMILTK